MSRYTKRNGLSRRTLLKTGVAAAAGTACRADGLGAV